MHGPVKLFKILVLGYLSFSTLKSAVEGSAKVSMSELNVCGAIELLVCTSYFALNNQNNTAFFFINRSNYEDLNFVSNYEPQNKDAKHLRVLLHGPVGAGKSSFVSSVDSVLHGKVSSRALADATSGSSFTLKVRLTVDHCDSKMIQ